LEKKKKRRKSVPDNCAEFAVVNHGGQVDAGAFAPEVSFDALQQMKESFTGEPERALRIKVLKGNKKNYKKGKKKENEVILSIFQLFVKGKDAFDQNLCDPLFFLFLYFY